MGIRPVRVTLAVSVMIMAALLWSAPRAVASCAAGAPSPSPYAFVGTVIDTRAGDRIATVVKDDGTRVTVNGAQGGSRWGSFSDVDRRYAVGGRYEFHPINATDPYRDDICTATRQLAGPPVPPLSTSGDRLPSWLPVDEQAGPIGYALVALPAFLVLVAGGFLGRWVRRRRRLDRPSG